MNEMWNAFLAFNQNAFAYGAHALMSNLWNIAIIVGIVGCIILHLKEEIVITVKEEQQVL